MLQLRLALCTSLLTLPACALSPADRPGAHHAGAGSHRTASAHAAPACSSVIDIDGRTHEIDRITRAGRRVVLIFWQTWCSPCRHEAPALAEASRKYEDSLSFFGVISGPAKSAEERDVREFVAFYRLPYPQVRDADLALTREFQVEGTPTIIVLGPEGDVIYRGHRPPADWNDVAPPAAAPKAPDLRGASRNTTVMGTEVVISLYVQPASDPEPIIDAAVAELERVENLMTDWRPSPLSTLNAGAGTGPQPVDPEIVALIARAKRIHALTMGAFDISYAAAGALWDFKRRPPRIPTDEEIARALPFIDASKIGVDLQAGTVDLPAGWKIGLGGIAKGYAVDRAMKVLMNLGIEHAVIKAGGDMKVLGLEHGQPWKVAVKHPRDRERVIAVLQASNTCISTSGDYERYFELEGRRYHHIIDPRTGRPALGAQSATVVAPEAAFADALATALCVLPPAEGIAMIESLPRVEALVVDHEGKIHASQGLLSFVNEPERSR